MIGTILNLDATQNIHVRHRIHVGKGAARACASRDGGNAEVEVAFLAPACCIVTALEWCYYAVLGSEREFD